MFFVRFDVFWFTEYSCMVQSVLSVFRFHKYTKDEGWGSATLPVQNTYHVWFTSCTWVDSEMNHFPTAIKPCLRCRLRPPWSDAPDQLFWDTRTFDCCEFTCLKNCTKGGYVSGFNSNWLTTASVKAPLDGQMVQTVAMETGFGNLECHFAGGERVWGAHSGGFGTPQGSRKNCNRHVPLDRDLQADPRPAGNIVSQLDGNICGSPWRSWNLWHQAFSS